MGVKEDVLIGDDELFGLKLVTNASGSRIWSKSEALFYLASFICQSLVLS